MIHADRLANAGRLLTVTAFAVYVQIKPLSLVFCMQMSGI